MGGALQNEPIRSHLRRQPLSVSPAGACVHVHNAASVHVHEVKDLIRHGVEPGPGLDVVIVMVRYEDSRGVHWKRPEAVEMHFFA